MKLLIKNKKCYYPLNKLKLLFIFLYAYNILFIALTENYQEKKKIKIALCTMGKGENLYINEFIEYYLKIGIDHIFIYDDNDPETEKISEIINKKYKYNVTVNETRKFNIVNQSISFSECYLNHINQYDWFLMVDMDEFLYIVDGTLKSYLTQKRFNKCDFIKFHWVIPKDNDLIYYDPRPLFERFKPPYIKSKFVKSIIRGNISDLRYWVHSPFISPFRNTSCTNVGKIIYRKNMNFEDLKPINTKMAYIIHFRYKSTEELVNKLKRGYKDWFKDNLKNFLIGNIISYLKYNKVTPEKIDFIEKELNLNLSEYIKDINKENY
jgi:hypothetical protein